MTIQAVLGIDVGLSGVRAAVVTTGRQVLACSDRVTVGRTSGDGLAEIDPRNWVQAMMQAATDAVARAKGVQVTVVAVAAVGPAPILVSRDLEPVTPAVLFSLDSRSEALRQHLLSEGHTLPSEHALPKLLWWREHKPDVFASADTVMDATGYLVAVLTGVLTMDHITRNDYLVDGLASPIRLPRIVDPLEHVGGLRRPLAEVIGIAADTPVVAGTYDCWADIAAAGVSRLGDAALVLGTTIIVGTARPSAPVPALGLRHTAHIGEGVLVGGWSANGGSTLDWARAVLGGRTAFDDTELADILPGSGGVVALPYLSGERSPVDYPLARGVIAGIRPDTERVHLHRAFVDAVALIVRDHADRIARTGPCPERWLTRGGAARSKVVLQAIADATGWTLDIPADAFDPLGPVELALRSLGSVTVPGTVESVIPDPRRTAIYHDLYAKYLDVQSRFAPELGAVPINPNHYLEDR